MTFEIPKDIKKLPSLDEIKDLNHLGLKNLSEIEIEDLKPLSSIKELEE